MTEDPLLRPSPREGGSRCLQCRDRSRRGASAKGFGARRAPAKPADLRKNEREMAVLLINTLSGPFEPERYPDQYRQKLNALIEGRAASAPAAIEAPVGTGVQDLMSALRASVEQARLASKARGKP